MRMKAKSGKEIGARKFAHALNNMLADQESWGAFDDVLDTDGAKNLARQANEILSSILAPPPDLTISEWAEEFAYLSAESSAEPGKWKSIPYQVGIMDGISDKENERVTWMKSARVGYTATLKHVVGYYAHQDPSPMLLAQPTIDDAKGFSVEEIGPMIRDTPALAKIALTEQDGVGVTQLRKRFKSGASLLLVGANSPRGFRRVTIRVVMFDEVDGYPATAGDEGDQIKLGVKRTETFWNRKIIMGSTPTVKGASRIAQHFEASDKRFYVVPCPQCDGRLILRWSAKSEYGTPIELPAGVKFAHMAWDNKDPETAHFVCGHSGCVIEEKHKVAMVSNGTWLATKPSRGHAGFHIWAGYSLFPNAAWSKLVEEYLDIMARKDWLALQVFVNTVLGEVWESRGERVEGSVLFERREDYGEVAPAQSVAVTAGVDIQGDRIEVEKVAWSPTSESWGIGKRVIYGDPTGPDIWDALHNVLAEPIEHELGNPLTLLCAAIDSGYLTNTVTAWCSERWARRWYAIKGQAGAGRPIWPKKVSKTKGKYPQFVLGVDEAKDLTYNRLRLETPGPGFCHYNLGYDEDHFTQLTSEEAKVEYERGQAIRRWFLRPGHKRNEALDLRVYATAAWEAAKIMGFKPQKRLERMVKRKEQEGIPTQTERQAQAQAASPQQGPRRKKSRFLSRRGDGW